MTWILTATGQQVDMRYPRPGSIVFADIAHALAQLPRFTGHARRPYSVAEHSLLVCEIAERELHLSSPHGLLAALLHDAHEAYVNDLSTPAKREVGDGWHQIEQRFETTLRRYFALQVAAFDSAALIRKADLMALATERAQLMPASGAVWTALDGIQPIGWVDLMDKGRCGFAWTDWRQAFTDRYHELEYARDAQAWAVGQHDGGLPA